MAKIGAMIKGFFPCVLLVIAGCDGHAPAPTVSDPQVSDVREEPFDFRGIKLGITRSEFKLYKNPPVLPADTKAWSLVATCSNDPQSRKSDSPYYDKRPSQSDCWWEYDSRRKGGEIWRRYTRAKIMVGSDGGDDYRFKFAAMPGDIDHKLYAIELNMPSKDWKQVVDAIAEKFGQPHLDRVSYTMDSGADVVSDVFVWERKESSIRVVKNVALYNVSSISYSLKKYAAYVWNQDKELESTRPAGM